MGRNLITVCLFLLPLISFARAQDEDFREKLRQLEQRIAILEKNQKTSNQNKANEDHQSGSDEAVSQTVEVEELRRQLDILADELERLRSGEESREVTSQEAQNRGLSKSAASVYGKSKGVSIAGYGEMLYENFDRADESGNIVDKSARLDFLRAILYAGYRFNDRFLFNSEIEFEHSSTDKSGSVSVEFAYLDFLINENLSLRGGLLLIPMGLINEFHEPNFFLGALRPQTEKVIIPTTWRENGFGIVGSYGPLSFRSYLVNGLDASGFSSSGLRGGRQKGSQAYAADMAWATRVDFEPTPGFLLGTSIYTGGSGQGLVRIEDQHFKVRNTIWDIHGTFRSRGWTIAGLFADSSVGDTEELNQFLKTNQDSPVASRLRGGYIQAGYNVLNRYHETVSLSPYYRFERINTQKKLPAGYQPDPSKIGWFHTFGFELKPISSIVLKTDYQWSRNEKSTGLNQFNIVLGYAF